MLGIVLLYVGIVLINNGVSRLTGIDPKAQAVMNILTGFLSVIINIINIIKGNYYDAGTGLLFAFTYLFVAANCIFDLDLRPYGWYSLFVAINAIPVTIMNFASGDWRFAIIWALWGILWATGFIETVMKKGLGRFVGYLAVFEGIVTAWIPGFLLLINKW